MWGKLRLAGICIAAGGACRGQNATPDQQWFQVMGTLTGMIPVLFTAMGSHIQLRVQDALWDVPVSLGKCRDARAASDPVSASRIR